MSNGSEAFRQEHLLDEYHEPTVKALSWCGLSPEEWDQHRNYILSADFGRKLIKPSYEFQPLLASQPDATAALQLMAFEQLRTLTLKRTMVVESSEHLENLLKRAKENKLLAADYDVKSEARLLWTHEHAHVQVLTELGVRTFLVLHPIDERFSQVTIQVICNVSDFQRLVELGYSLTHLLGKVLMAPALSDVFHYTEEDELAVDLLQAAQQQGHSLTQDEEDFILWFSERFFHSRSKKGTRNF